MTAIAYTFTLTDGREITTDPEEFDTPEAQAAADSKTDLEIETVGLRALETAARDGGMHRVLVGGRRVGVSARHVLLAAVEVYR